MRSFLQTQAASDLSSTPLSTATASASVLELLATSRGTSLSAFSSVIPRDVAGTSVPHPGLQLLSSSPLKAEDGTSPLATPVKRRVPIPVTSPISSPARPHGGTKSLPYCLPHPPYSPDKPNYSYAALIGQAILASYDHKLSLSDIYKYITTVYPYFQNNQLAWQNSIRHNLSLNPCFKKIDRLSGQEVDRSSKGSLWSIAEEHVAAFEGGNFKKPVGLTYVSAKRRTKPDVASELGKSAKRAKYNHPNTFVTQPTFSLFPLATSYEAALHAESVAASSSASSPPPSAASTSSLHSSSSVPDLTNSSSSPPDQDDEECEELTSCEQIAPAALSSSPSIITRPRELKGPDLLSRVIEAKATKSPSIVIAPQTDTPGGIFPQSNLRTPTHSPSVFESSYTTRTPSKDKGKGRANPLDQLQWTLPLPITPLSNSRCKTPPPRHTPGGLPMSPEKTPISYKGVHASPRHPELLKDGLGIRGGTFSEFIHWDKNWGDEETVMNLPDLDASFQDDKESTPRRSRAVDLKPSTHSATPRTPRKSVIRHNQQGETPIGTNNPSALRPRFSPSLFRTPFPPASSLHPPLFDPYDLPAALADELNQIENPNARGYGESPGSFFGRRRGFLYDSPIRKGPGRLSDYEL